jgi:hypothetical protein
MSRSKRAPGHGHGGPEQLDLELGKFRKVTPKITASMGMIAAPRRARMVCAMRASDGACW